MIALVGSDSLLGREIRDLASTSATPFSLRLIAAEEEQAGTLTRVGDEPAALEELTALNLAGARAVFLAGSLESSRKALELAASEPDLAIIDLTGAAEDLPDARLRAPAVEAQAAEEEPAETAAARFHIVAHPAAIAMALFLRRLHAQNAIRRAVIQVFAPASEHGVKGVEELQQQTVSLLSFKPLPTAVFDSQASFNLLAQYGEEAPAPLEEIELRIERHLATLLNLPGAGEGVPLPSLRVVQAPVFHGYSFSAWVEFEDSLEVETIESGLAAANIEVRSGEFEPPNNVGQAGQSGIAVGAIAPDRNVADAAWFWVVADNLRLSAENAIAVARELV